MNEVLLQRAKEYFSGEMSPENKLLFEEEMKSNKDLSAIVELYQTIDDGIEKASDESEEELLLRRSLKNIHEQHLKQQEELRNDGETLESSPEKGGKLRRVNKTRFLAIAAISTGVIVLGLLWLLQRNNNRNNLADKEKEMNTDSNIVNKHTLPDTNQTKRIVTKEERIKSLYALNFKPDSVPAEYHALLNEGLRQYREGAYANTIASIDPDKIRTALEELRPRGQQSSKEEAEEKATIFYAQYYKALSYMAVGSNEKAIALLRSAVQYSPNLLHRTKVQWYLSLALIGSGKVEEAKRLLGQIAGLSASNPYQQKAGAMLNELNKD